MWPLTTYPSGLISRPLSLGNSWMTTSTHRNFFPFASWLEPISPYSWCPPLFLLCILPGLAPVFRAPNRIIKMRMPPRSPDRVLLRVPHAFIPHFLDFQSSLSPPLQIPLELIQSELSSPPSSPNQILFLQFQCVLPPSHSPHLRGMAHST